jgi:hypothetical protein
MLRRRGLDIFRILKGLRKKNNNTGARMTSSTSDNPQENEKKITSSVKIEPRSSPLDANWLDSKTECFR